MLKNYSMFVTVVPIEIKFKKNKPFFKAVVDDKRIEMMYAALHFESVKYINYSMKRNGIKSCLLFLQKRYDARLYAEWQKFPEIVFAKNEVNANLTKYYQQVMNELINIKKNVLPKLLANKNTKMLTKYYKIMCNLQQEIMSQMQKVANASNLFT